MNTTHVSIAVALIALILLFSCDKPEPRCDHSTGEGCYMPYKQK